MAFIYWALISALFAAFGYCIVANNNLTIVGHIFVSVALLLFYVLFMQGPLVFLSLIIPCQCCGSRDTCAYDSCCCDRWLPYKVINLRNLIWPWHNGYYDLGLSLVCRGICD